MKQGTINSSTYAWAKSMINPKVRIVDAYVYNQWLCLQLDSGVLFKVKNNI